MNQHILDTFIFKNEKIYLKEFHLARTSETLNFLKMNKIENLRSIYDSIEKEHSQTSNDHVYRLEIDPHDLLNWKLDIRKKNRITEPFKLFIFTVHKKNEHGLYKWADRNYWDTYKNQITEQTDVLLVNSEKKLIEASRFNIVLFNKELNIAITPPLSSGCLKGVYREYCLNRGLIEIPDRGTKKIIEADVFLDDLNKHQLYLINSVREVLAVNSLDTFEKSFNRSK